MTTTRLRKLAARAALLALVASACGGPSAPTTGAASRPEAPRPDPAGSMAAVLIRCHPPDADLRVDGGPPGPVSGVGEGGKLLLPPGVHRFEFGKAGYRTFRIELDLKVGEEKLEVNLELLPRERSGP